MESNSKQLVELVNNKSKSLLGVDLLVQDIHELTDTDHILFELHYFESKHLSGNCNEAMNFLISGFNSIDCVI